MVSPDVATYNLHPYAIIVLPIPLAIISTVAISVRIWIRSVLARSFGRDDVCLILAHICFLAACGVFIAIGVTEYNEGLTPIVKLAELSILGIALYLLNQCFFKLSMALFFLRIPNKRLHRTIIIASVSISIIFNIALLIISITQCGDIASIDLNHPHCLSWSIQGPLNYFCAALNAAVDWIFAALAIYVVQGLTLDTKSKISVYAIILLASAGSIVSVVRIPYIPGLRLDKSYYSQENDIIAYTSLVEAAIGIIVASMSVMRPLVVKLRERARIALSSGGGSGYSSRASKKSAQRAAAAVVVQKVELPKGLVQEVRLWQALPDPTPTIEDQDPGTGVELDYLNSKTLDVEKGYRVNVTTQTLQT